MKDAVDELPGLLAKAQKKLQENPERGLKFLAGLKGNSYATMPGVENTPREFLDYYQYLTETQGPEEAKKRIEDFVQQSAVNKAKSEMF